MSIEGMTMKGDINTAGTAEIDKTVKITIRFQGRKKIKINVLYIIFSRIGFNNIFSTLYLSKNIPAIPPITAKKFIKGTSAKKTKKKSTKSKN